MAIYYWVGGSGTWDNSSNTNWAASSGGAGGVGPPVTGDTVNFDSNSGTSATVTVAATAACTACTINKSDINLSLSGSPTFAGALTLTTGTITLNANTLTVLTFSSSNTNTRAIAFGTGNITITGNSGAVWAMSTMTGFSYTGTPAVNCTYSGSTGTRTIQPGTTGATESNALSFNITAGTDTVAITLSAIVKSLNFEGFSGGLSNNGYTAYGDVTFSGTMTIAGGTTPSVTFAATSGTQKLKTNGWGLNFAVTVNCPGATVQLQDACTVTNTSTAAFTFTAGTLDLNNNDLSVAGRFSATAGNVRSILFGSKQIKLTGNGLLILNFTNFTNFTYTGTPVFNLTYSGGTGTRSITVGNTGVTESNVISVLASAGTDTVTSGASCTFKNLDFTGFAGTLGIFIRDIYGDLTLSTGMTLTAGTNATTFLGTSGPYTITSNGKTMDFPITFNGVGGTWQPADALAIGSARAFTLTNGTFNAGSQNITIGTFALGSGTKTLTLGSGTWTVAGSDWNANTNVTGLTVSASTGTISMTSGSAKTFSGGALTWPTLNQGGAGALTIAQSNTFANITDTVQPATVTLTAGTTQTVTSLGLAGTSGNLITLNSSVAGTRATIFKASGSVSLSFVSIKDIAATGGANFNAFTSNGCVDGGNNTGWDFNSALYPTIYTVRKTKRYFLN